MSNKIENMKRKLDEAIQNVCDAIGIFSAHPERDFSRERILTPDKLIRFLLSMEGGVLGTEMLNHFGCSVKTPSSSAFVQQRAKIGPDMLPALLELFIQKTDIDKRYKGLRLLAVDGSDILIPTNPHDVDSYFIGTDIQKHYNLLHLDAMYDFREDISMQIPFDPGDCRHCTKKPTCDFAGRLLLAVMKIKLRGHPWTTP